MKKLNPIILPYAGALVQAVLFTLAGVAHFGGWLGGVAGFGVGAVVNLSMAIASSKISNIAQKRKPLAYVSLVGLFCLSPVIITSSMGWSVATLSWSMAADLAILLTGAITGGSLIVAEPAASQPKPKAKREKPATAEPQPAAEPIKPAFVCSCGKSFGSQPALNAHQRTHKGIAGYAVSFEPIQKEQTK